MNNNISFMIKAFSIIAILLAIAFQLYISHIEYSYSLFVSGTAVADAPLYDDDVLFKPYDYIIKYQKEANDILSSSSVDWTIAHNSDSNKIEFRPTAQNDSSRIDSSGLFRLTTELETNLSELELFDYLSIGEGLSWLYPHFFFNSSITISNPPLLSWDWSEGSLDVVRIDCPLFWPFFDRSFTLLNIVHPAQRLFISKSIALSETYQRVAQVSHSSYRVLRPASLYMAFSVRNIPLAYTQNKSPVAPDATKQNKHTSTTTNRWRHQLQIIYLLENILPRSSLSHRIVLNRFLPNTIRALRNTIKRF